MVCLVKHWSSNRRNDPSLQLLMLTGWTPRWIRKSDRNPPGSEEAGRTQKCRVNALSKVIFLLTSSTPYRRWCFHDCSISKCLRASHRRRFMSVIERPMKIQYLSCSAAPMIRFVKEKIDDADCQYWLSVNINISSYLYIPASLAFSVRRGT